MLVLQKNILRNISEEFAAFKNLKPMDTDFFFLGNLVGRFGWAAVSDKIGRRATFNIFTLGAVPIFALTPYMINQV